ncbi:hypothetical protein [Kutzneria buriramensis]|uniref:Uncharacterized protein n=1 Tax=Kutzneria buriramensis TaxID=1045776 RepID=A0A3E0H7D3_9PSEU|nr:hypothetical protein [Kutzneria buriramensis]REH39228.1 hypothetical protein BCF44_11383 [Kutzneria buriramensis]
MHCAGKSEVDSRATDPTDPQLIMRRDMTGGPCLADFDATTGVGVVVPVNSSSDPQVPDTEGGKVFGAETKEPLAQAGRG